MQELPEPVAFMRKMAQNTVETHTCCSLSRAMNSVTGLPSTRVVGASAERLVMYVVLSDIIYCVKLKRGAASAM